ncbi:hypothetical protein SAMD00019534_002060, partial [Acytostelium subglobosum LB1]|uniref:hypothetical protein n=1 Tax=Acytostelium subglobosum LB1 TaxID=1410327 RepID=UPI000644EEA5
MTTCNKPIWMHIGAGNFHRAHQAYYINRLIVDGNDEEGWSIALGNMLNDHQEDIIKQLEIQHGQYVLELNNTDGSRTYEVIKSIKKTIPFHPSAKYLIEQGASSDTRVISFTISESGYFHNENFDLLLNNEHVDNDLKTGSTQTIYGVMAKILRERMLHSKAPVTLISCDNIRKNSNCFKRCFEQFLQKLPDTDLLKWIDQNVRFPNSMVDRITPHPSDDLVERVRQQGLGFEDKVPVMAESFIQWVVEDNFINGRPKLELAGVEMTQSVLPYEEAKVRILNASHACFAWAGTLVGLTYISEDIANPDIHKIVYDYITEDVIPTLKAEHSPLNLEKYRDVVLERFKNKFLKDTNERVGKEGHTKIPGFLLPTIVACYKRGAVPRATAKLPAIFFVFLERWSKNQIPYEYHDGVMDKDQVHKMFSQSDPLAEYIHDPKVFCSLAGNKEFEKLLCDQVREVREWLSRSSDGTSMTEWREHSTR